MFLRIGAVALVLILAGSAATSGSATSPLLPDLRPFPASDLSLETKNGKTYVRFSTLSWNSGSGPLELFVKDEPLVNDRQPVYQRIYLEGGGSHEVHVGDFVYHHDHDHFHFEGYAKYELRDGSGSNRLFEGSKTSFCLMDTDRIDHRLPGAPKRPVYRTCNNDVQGISVGWGDKYGAHLEGQSLEVPESGEYYIRVIIDPHDLLERANSDGDFNVSDVRICVDIEAGQVSEGACSSSGDGGRPGSGRPPSR